MSHGCYATFGALAVRRFQQRAAIYCAKAPRYLRVMMLSFSPTGVVLQGREGVIRGAIEMISNDRPSSLTTCQKLHGTPAVSGAVAAGRVE